MDARKYEIVNMTKVPSSYNGNGCGLLLAKKFTAWNSETQKQEVRTELVNLLVDAAGFSAVTKTKLSELRRGARISVDGRIQATISQNSQGEAMPGLRVDIGTTHYSGFEQGSGPVMGVKGPQRAAAPAQAPAAPQAQAVVEDNVF